MGDLFVNPWLLGGAALAAAPLIIHLLNKRRYRVHEWAAMDFLFAAMVSNRRRLRFEDLILLLLRMAIILLLVFAIARPIFRGLAGWREDERIVVLDDSASMAVVGPTGPVFELAREGAIHQVRDAVGGGVPVTVWLGSDPVDEAGRIETAIGGGVVEESDGAANDDPRLRAALAGKDLLEALRVAEPCDLPLRFADVVARVIEEAREDPVPKVRSIVLVSDFRAADWTLADGSLRDTLRVVLEDIERLELEESIRFQFVDVGLPSSENIAITDLRIEDTPVLAGVPVRISVEVTNFGEEPRIGVSGDLEIGRADVDVFEPAHSIPLPAIGTLDAGKNVRVEVEHVFDAGGEYPLRAVVEGVRLVRDNESHAVAVVRDALAVAVVDGAPALDRFESESGLLIAALQPRGDSPSGVEAARIVGPLSAAALRGADALFVLNRAEISTAEREVIADFVARGGGLAWFVGGNVEPTVYAKLATASDGRAALFPATIREDEPLSTPSTIAHLRFDDLQHPAVALLRGVRDPTFDHVIFRRFFALRPLAGARVLAHYDDAASTPAIVESVAGVARVVTPDLAGATTTAAAGGVAVDGDAGDDESAAVPGRIIVFNTTADRDWSDWPADYTYPVLVQEFVRHLASGAAPGRLRTLGAVLAVPELPGMRFTVILPGGEKLAIDDIEETASRDVVTRGAAVVARRERRVRPRHAGLCRIIGEARADAVVGPLAPAAHGVAVGLADGRADGGAPSGTRQWVAFRRPASESDLRALGEERLRELFEPFDVAVSIGSEVEIDEFRREQEGEVWRWLAFACGLFLVLELFAAWWFGRRP